MNGRPFALTLPKRMNYQTFSDRAHRSLLGPGLHLQLKMRASADQNILPPCHRSLKYQEIKKKYRKLFYGPSLLYIVQINLNLPRSTYKLSGWQASWTEYRTHTSHHHHPSSSAAHCCISWKIPHTAKPLQLGKSLLCFPL